MSIAELVTNSGFPEIHLIPGQPHDAEYDVLICVIDSTIDSDNVKIWVDWAGASGPENGWSFRCISVVNDNEGLVLGSMSLELIRGALLCGLSVGVFSPTSLGAGLAVVAAYKVIFEDFTAEQALRAVYDDHLIDYEETKGKSYVIIMNRLVSAELRSSVSAFEIKRNSARKIISPLSITSFNRFQKLAKDREVYFADRKGSSSSSDSNSSSYQSSCYHGTSKSIIITPGVDRGSIYSHSVIGDKQVYKQESMYSGKDKQVYKQESMYSGKDSRSVRNLSAYPVYSSRASNVQSDISKHGYSQRYKSLGTEPLNRSYSVVDSKKKDKKSRRSVSQDVNKHTIPRDIITSHTIYRAPNTRDTNPKISNLLKAGKVSPVKSNKYANKDHKYANKDTKYANKDTKYANKDHKYANKDHKYANKDTKYANKDHKYANAPSIPILRERYPDDGLYNDHKYTKQVSQSSVVITPHHGIQNRTYVEAPFQGFTTKTKKEEHKTKKKKSASTPKPAPQKASKWLCR